MEVTKKIDSFLSRRFIHSCVAGRHGRAIFLYRCESTVERIGSMRPKSGEPS